MRRGNLAKLSAQEAQQIHDLLCAGWFQQEIADLYGVGQGTVSRIKLGGRRGSWADELEPVDPDERYLQPRRRKLTPPETCQVRQLITGGWLQQDIADAYGISQSAVSLIKLGRNA